MTKIRQLSYLYCLTLFSIMVVNPAARAEDNAQASQVTSEGGTVWGIVTDKKNDFVMLKLDNETQLVKYVVPHDADPKLVDSFKGIFPVARVHLTYINKVGMHQVVSIERDMSKSDGVVTGEFLAAHGWWIEVKTKDGVPDGYAPNWGGGPEWQSMCNKFKILRKGEIVTLHYHSDFERKRVDTLEIAGK